MREYVALTALSATQVVIAYSDEGNSGYGTAIAGALADTGFFWGPASVFNAALTGDIGLAALSLTEVVVGYQDEGNARYGTAIPGTLNSGSLTWGPADVFNPGDTRDIAVATLLDSSVIIAYEDLGNNAYGTAIIGALGDGSLTWGSETIFNPATTSNIDVAVLSETGVVVTYNDYSQSGRATAITGALSGGVATWGSACPVPGSPASSPRVAALSETEMAVVYKGPGNAGTAVIGKAAGETIVWSRAGVFNVDDIGFLDVAALPGVDFVVAYLDQSNSNYGTARVSDRMARRVIGIAENAADGGESVIVVVGGVADGQTGLTPGYVYYWQDDGSLGTAPTNTRVGLAISATELILDDLWTQ